MNAMQSLNEANTIIVTNPKIDVIKAVELYRNGVSQENMAIELHVSRDSLVTFLRRNEGVFPKRARPQGALSPSDIERASSMWKAGAELKDIAAKFGVSKNVIIGQANSNREMFPHRRPPTGQRAKKAEVPPKPKKTKRGRGNWNTNLFGVAKSTIAKDPSYTARKTEYDAERMQFAKPLHELEPCECHWPLTDRGPYLFCAAEASKTYCEHHEARS